MKHLQRGASSGPLQRIQEKNNSRHLYLTVPVPGAWERPEPVGEQILLLTRKMAGAMKWMERLMPIACEFYALAGRDKEVRQFLSDYSITYRGNLARLIEFGIKRAESRAIDANATAVALTALFEGTTCSISLILTALQWDKQIETAVQMLLAGIRL